MRKDLIDSLGIDVELTRKELENDPWSQKMVREVGESMRVEGMKYMGSIAVHYYVDETALIKDSYSLAVQTQITFKNEISEQLALMGWNTSAIDLRKYYNPSFVHKTTRKGDKRGENM